MSKIRIAALAAIALFLVTVHPVPAAAQFGLFSPFTGLAAAVASKIVTALRGETAPAAVSGRESIKNGSAKGSDPSTGRALDEALAALSRERTLQLIAALQSAPPRGSVAVDLADPALARDAEALFARLERLEAQERIDFQDLEVARRGALPALPVRPSVAVALETENLPVAPARPYEPPIAELEKMKDKPANSQEFRSFFARLKDALPKAETKTWVDYATKKEKSSELNPPDLEIRYRTGASTVIDKFENKQKTSFHWDNQPSVEKAYTSHFLNVKDDPGVMNKTLVAAGNSQFDKVSLDTGNTKFGWTHIAYDRPDGTNHAREIKEAFGLPNQDKAVRDFIMETVRTGNAEEQVRMRDGKPQSRYLYTRNVDGKEIKVVVDNDKYPGSLITAYPTGKMKVPNLAEIQKRIEEERKRRAEEAKKNVKWRKPTLSIDLFKRERTVAVGPQFSAGAEQKFRLGGAEIANSATFDTLLGGEATGAVYGGFRDGVLGAGVRGSVFAGARARGNLASAVKVGEMGVRGFVGGEVSAGAGANADAHVGIGKEGLQGSISGDAFVGVRAKGQVGGTLSYGDVKVTGALNGTVGAGLGAHFDVTGKIGWSGVKAHVDVGAYLGVGGQLGFDINLDFGTKLDPLKRAVEGAVDRGREVVGKVRDGAKKVGRSIARLFDW